MKKMSIIFALSLFSLTLFTGCQSRSGENTAELKNQISQLEQQVTDLKSQQSNSTTTPSPEASKESSSGTVTSDTTQQAEQSAPQTEAPTTQTSKTQSPKTIEELTALVDAFAQKADTASPSGTGSEQRNQFFALKSELDSIELELNRYDDLLEADFRTGTLSANEYYTKENNLERLEDQLDKSENTLEFLFGIDD